MIWLSIVVGAAFSVVLLALAGVIPRDLHVGSPRCSRQCALLWPLFALMQPLNGIVFAIDGILIGASDGRYLALSMAAAFAVCAAALAVVVWADWGVRGVWARARPAHRHAPRADGRTLPPAALARDRVRLGARARGRRSQLACTATSVKPARRMLRYELEGRSSRRSPVSVTTTSHPASRACSIRAASNAFWAPLPRCSGRVAAKPRYPTPSAMKTPAAAAGSSPSSASQQSQPSRGLAPPRARRRREGRSPWRRSGRSPAPRRRRRERAGASVERAGDRLDAASERHPAPAGLEPAVARASSASSAGGFRRDRDVAGDVVADRRQRRIEGGLRGRLVDAEADDPVQHRAQRRGARPGGR